MPRFAVVDTHVHLWDPGRISYSWQQGNPLLNRCYEVEDYPHGAGTTAVEAMVFVECHVDDGPGRGQYIQEIEYAEEQVKRNPRIRALVAKAPLERGRAVAGILEEMVARFPRVRGIRRIPEFEPDPRGFLLSRNFIQGVRLLGQFGLHFELNVNYAQMDDALEFLEQVPNVPIVLDHCGKPGIRGGKIADFSRHMKAVAARPNVMCKLSDLSVEANWRSWTEEDLRPYIEETVAAFGIDRVMYGGDWPVCLQATTLDRWIQVLDNALAGLSACELYSFYRENANLFYRLNL
jgi:L-fuconolactonase